MLAAELLAISIGESTSSVRARLDEGPAVAFAFGFENEARLSWPLTLACIDPVELSASKMCSVRLRLMSS